MTNAFTNRAALLSSWLLLMCRARTSVTRAAAREARRAAPIPGEPVWGRRGRLAPAAALKISSPVFLMMHPHAHSQAR